MPSAPDQPGRARAAVPLASLLGLRWGTGLPGSRAPGLPALAAPGPPLPPSPSARFPFPSCSRAWAVGAARGPIVSRAGPGDPCGSRRAAAGAALSAEPGSRQGDTRCPGSLRVRGGFPPLPPPASWGSRSRKVRTEIPSNLFKGLAAAACKFFFFSSAYPPPHPAPAAESQCRLIPFPFPDSIASLHVCL